MATIITGQRATSDLSSQRLKVDLADQIFLLDPNENPFVLISKQSGTVTAIQPKHSWLEDVLQPEKDQVNFDTGYTSVKTAITVDNVSYFAVDDLVQVFDSYEIMRVSAKSSDGIVEFERNWPGVSSGETGFPTALVDNDWLIIMNNVIEEGDTAPSAKTTQETQVDNFTQIIRTPFELTETQIASLMHAEQDLPYQTRKNGIEHARQIEYGFIWGIPNGTNTGDNSKPKRSMGGLWWYLKENAPAANIVSQTELTLAEFNEWVRNCFRYGSKRKVMFASPLILSAIEHWGQIKLQTRPSDKTFGIDTVTWVSPHGTISIVNHKLLEGPNPGTAGSWAFMVDMEMVKYVPLSTRDTKLLTGRQENDRDTNEAEYLTECCLQIANPEKHGVLYNVTSFAA